MRALQAPNPWISAIYPLHPYRAAPQRFLACSGKQRCLPRTASAASSTPASSGAEQSHSSTNNQSIQLAVTEGIAEPMSEEAIATEQQRRKKLWFAAIKPPMYTVSIIPVLVSAKGFSEIACTQMT